jgi:hypothetical protein
VHGAEENATAPGRNRRVSCARAPEPAKVAHDRLRVLRPNTLVPARRSRPIAGSRQNRNRWELPEAAWRRPSYEARRGRCRRPEETPPPRRDQRREECPLVPPPSTGRRRRSWLDPCRNTPAHHDIQGPEQRRIARAAPGHVATVPSSDAPRSRHEDARGDREEDGAEEGGGRRLVEAWPTSRPDASGRLVSRSAWNRVRTSADRRGARRRAGPRLTRA